MTDEIILDYGNSLGVISPLIYGHFSEHIGGVFYDGLWVGEDSPVENIRGFRKALVDSFAKLEPPVLRWPGGCFAETYDWRDGIGPREARPERAGWWYPYDHRTESNAVGTHEFIDFCRMVGAEPYFAANMTSLTPLDIRNWVEYCNMDEGRTTLARERAANGSPEPFDVRFWGIGNENWGGGGQMTPEMNIREFVHYATVCASLDKGRRTRFIFCGANGHDIDWTHRCMEEWKKTPHDVKPWGMSVHYYCGTAGDPQTFTEDEWYRQLFQAGHMRRIVEDHRAALDEFDPDRRIGLVVDEWGCWHKDGTGPSRGYNLFEQQSSMRDAVVAAMTLNIFNDHCDSVVMANVAQLCNNLHSLYLAGGEHFVETPNYHVFAMYKGHKGGRHVNTVVHTGKRELEGFGQMDMLSVSASEKDGVTTVTVANLDMREDKSVRLTSVGGSLSGRGTVTVLRADDVHTCNTFEEPFAVVPYSREAVFTRDDVIDIPAASVVAVTIEKQ